MNSVAVVGPLADDAGDQLGPDQPIGYSVDNKGKGVVTVLRRDQGRGPNATVTTAPGSDTTWDRESTTGFGAAVDAAQVARM